MMYVCVQYNKKTLEAPDSPKHKRILQPPEYQNISGYEHMAGRGHQHPTTAATLCNTQYRYGKIQPTSVSVCPIPVSLPWLWVAFNFERINEKGERKVYELTVTPNPTIIQNSSHLQGWETKCHLLAKCPAGLEWVPAKGRQEPQVFHLLKTWMEMRRDTGCYSPVPSKFYDTSISIFQRVLNICKCALES